MSVALVVAADLKRCGDVAVGFVGRCLKVRFLLDVGFALAKVRQVALLVQSFARYDDGLIRLVRYMLKKLQFTGNLNLTSTRTSSAFSTKC